MRNVVLTGIGGQGTVLAAKILAQAAENRGWHVRTAETIGMAQRGGSVVSHVRMGDAGERVDAPLVAQGAADVLIAFEPGEGVRALPLLAADGVLVTATRAVQPVTASLAGGAYDPAPLLAAARTAAARAVVVDEAPLLERIGTARALNIVLLAAAVSTGAVGVSAEELRRAVAVCVKPRFVDMNRAAIDVTLAALQ